MTIDCPAPPAVVNYETAVGNGNSSPAIVSLPAGTSSGDLLVVGLVYEKGTGTTVYPPSGWTLIRTENKANQLGLATYFKIAGGSEPTTYVFDLSNSPKWSIGISRIVGADRNNPIVASNSASGNKSDTADAPSVTTNICNSLVLAFYSNKKDSDWTPASGTTEVYDAPNNQNGLTSNMMAYFIQAGKGATGTKTATASYSEVWVAQQVAIRPALGAAGSSSARNATASSSPEGNHTVVGEGSFAEASFVLVTAYPSPVKDFVSLTVEGMESKLDKSQVAVFDGIGRSYPVNATLNEDNSLRLDFSNMNRGFYIIKVGHTRGIQTVKIYKE